MPPKSLWLRRSQDFLAIQKARLLQTGLRSQTALKLVPRKSREIAQIPRKTSRPRQSRAAEISSFTMTCSAGGIASGRARSRYCLSLIPKNSLSNPANIFGLFTTTTFISALLSTPQQKYPKNYQQRRDNEQHNLQREERNAHNRAQKRRCRKTQPHLRAFLPPWSSPPKHTAHLAFPPPLLHNIHFS